MQFKVDALRTIAHKAYERNIGARGLRSIMEQTMMDMMYEIPSDESVKKITVTSKMIK